MGGGPSFSYTPPVDHSAEIIAAMQAQNAEIAKAQAAYNEKALALADAQSKAQLDYNKWAADQQRTFESTQAEAQRQFQDEYSTKQAASAAEFAKQQQEREIQAAKEREAAVKLGQDQASYRAAVETANQQAMQGQNYALQQAGAQDAVQKAYDAASAADFEKQVAQSGQSVTGPSFNIGQAQQQQQQNLRAAAPKLNPAAYNTAMQSKNPADKTAASMYANQLGNTQVGFAAPKINDLSFGGV
jgi:hypothetical protein